MSLAFSYVRPFVGLDVGIPLAWLKKAGLTIEELEELLKAQRQFMGARTYADELPRVVAQRVTDESIMLTVHWTCAPELMGEAHLDVAAIKEFVQGVLENTNSQPKSVKTVHRYGPS